MCISVTRTCEYSAFLCTYTVYNSIYSLILLILSSYYFDSECMLYLKVSRILIYVIIIANLISQLTEIYEWFKISGFFACVVIISVIINNIYSYDIAINNTYCDNTDCFKYMIVLHIIINAFFVIAVIFYLII